ncbi:hypothetical protein HBI56_061640 [Parastagonospora nodorum]|uniref:Uncharacterized protein n=1 Tax=Phaeosphaeria nodorum (strain SN15 / ATCC MYA-4574 / FGSC 10173) TaxID=321614 RepID=A0A7U2F4H8_PHANO|nr:hypothetical protein HBH56_156930 [Parastagonospora nodorum]QRC97503.1 hypothetical protein JI435_410660 [Parastagonospora nodorum SN15]KAH3922926.1 hypothetical protein HBH54_217810 [Parastagonospora nodorum]KAH3947100.1 hypothetical protein HBH53_124960 [Parastagonospora nodorum]KAH3969733.1 hypothetical protein HBH52_172960 [Parastagonospora nodorum]
MTGGHGLFGESYSSRSTGSGSNTATSEPFCSRLALGLAASYWVTQRLGCGFMLQERLV